MATSATPTGSRPSAYPTYRQASSMSASISRWSQQQANLQSNWPIKGCHHRHSQTLARTRGGLTERAFTPWQATKSNSPILKAQKSHKGRATNLRLYFHCLEHRPTQRPSTKDYWNQDMQRLAATTGACGGLCLSPAQTHPEGQTQREGLS